MNKDEFAPPLLTSQQRQEARADANAPTTTPATSLAASTALDGNRYQSVGNPEQGDNGDIGALCPVPEEHDLEAGTGSESGRKETPKIQIDHSDTPMLQLAEPVAQSPSDPLSQQGGTTDDDSGSDPPSELSLITRSVIHQGFKEEYLNQLYGQQNPIAAAEAAAATILAMTQQQSTGGAAGLQAILSTGGLPKVPSTGGLPKVPSTAGLPKVPSTGGLQPVSPSGGGSGDGTQEDPGLTATTAIGGAGRLPVVLEGGAGRTSSGGGGGGRSASGGGDDIPSAALLVSASPFSRGSGATKVVAGLTAAEELKAAAELELQRQREHVDELYRAAVVVDQVKTRPYLPRGPGITQIDVKSFI